MADENIFKELIIKNILSVKKSRLELLDSISISTYGSRAWAFTLQELGKKKDAAFLTKLGYTMGIEAAREIFAVLSKKKTFLPKKITDMTQVIQIAGFGIVELSSEKNKFKVIVKNNHIIDFAKQEYGSDSMVCSFYQGIYGAFIEVFQSKPVKLNHAECICKGKKACVFEE